jgi:hypothetical protein
MQGRALWMVGMICSGTEDEGSYGGIYDDTETLTLIPIIWFGS